MCSNAFVVRLFYFMNY